MTQLGFDNLLTAAAEDNRKREFARETAHLPGTMAEGIAHYRLLIRQHHAVMLAADVDKAMSLRREADRLAWKLNGGESGILAHKNAPGKVLARETAAAPGTVPLWGQEGEFIIEVNGTCDADASAWRVRVRVEMDGMFGTGSTCLYWPGFAAHAVDYLKPFISETGYRSFIGIHADPVPGLTPDTFAAKLIAAFVAGELKGKLRTIGPRCREHAENAA